MEQVSREPADLRSRNSPPVVVVAVPGLTGGVDEAARHLFTDDNFGGRWSIRIVTTKGLRTWAAPLVFAVAVARIVYWRARRQIDLVHLNVAWRGSTLRKVQLALVCRLLRLPYVVQVHSGVESYRRFFTGLPGPFRHLVRGMFGDAQHVFVLGHPFVALVCDDLGVARERVSVIRNAVEINQPAIGPGDGEPPTILFTGRLGHRKATKELVEALGRIDHRPWKAVLVGDGEVEETKDRVKDLGLDGRVDVRGWQSRSTINGLLASASVFVLPSRQEALSIALLEAMAAGLCCVATPVGAQAEVLHHGENGLMVTPGDVVELADVLARTVTDPELRATLGQAARETVLESCSIPAVSSDLADRYDAVLAG